MEKSFKTFVLILFIFLFHPLEASHNAGHSQKTSSFDWTPIIESIIQVESNGNRLARSGNSVGVLQITPILVRECNNILKSRKSKKRFNLADRYNVARSKEMFVIFQSQHNPTNDIERAIRSWNGGNNYNVRKTQRYYEKVMKVLGKNKKIAEKNK